MSDHENSQTEETVDDVAGHGKTMPKIAEDTDTDDVAGHGKTMPKISDDDDANDVAGHGKTMPKISDDDSDGPGFVSGALSTDDSLPSARAK